MTNFPMPPRSMSLDFISVWRSCRCGTRRSFCAVLARRGWNAQSGQRITWLDSTFHHRAGKLRQSPNRGRNLEHPIRLDYRCCDGADLQQDCWRELSAPRAMTIPGGPKLADVRASQSSLANLPRRFEGMAQGLWTISALPPKADMDQSGCDVRFVPVSDTDRP